MIPKQALLKLVRSVREKYHSSHLKSIRFDDSEQASYYAGKRDAMDDLARLIKNVKT